MALKPIIPKHITIPRGTSNIVRCHPRLDIAVFKMASGRNRLFVGGVMTESVDPVNDLLDLYRSTDRTTREWAKIFFKVDL